MAKETPIQNTFDGGELSPLLGGRTDLAKYFNGCSVLENFLPMVQGPLVRRGGTQFIGGTKSYIDRAWLVRFQVSESVSYMLEFGHLYVRFYTNRGRLVDGGVPVEVATPYTASDLTNADGTCAIRVAQSADTMYIFHLRHKPRKLLRLSATSFSLQEVQFTGGPFKDLNRNDGVTVASSAAFGFVTLTATGGNVFDASNVGSLFYLESAELAGIKPWATHQRVNLGEFRRVGLRVYGCTAVGTGNAAVTGTVTPTHTEGKAWDGDGVDVDDDLLGPIGVEWQYFHSGYGIVRIDAVSSPTVATGEVVSLIPDDIVASGTHKWAHAMFSSSEGWPEHGAFWRERLVLARDRRVAMSVSADFENFSAKDPDEAKPDSAITQTLNAKQINRILWVVESDDLIIGTNGDEWAIGPIQNTEAVGPSNIRASRRTGYGSRAIQPAEVGGRVLFVQASGKKLRDYQYDYTQDNYASADTTKLASHMLRSGAVDIAYQQEPDSIIWVARQDGRLVGCTYDQEAGRSDVYAWHTQPMVNGWVEAVETMPAPDGGADDVWLIVRREINGSIARYVELLRAPLSDEEPQAEAFYVDSGLTYRGPEVEEVSGLEHLEGQTVQILIDGATHPDSVVQGGKVSLQGPGSVIHVGLPAPCAMATMSIEAGAANGTAQGKLKRLTNVIARLHRSLGGNLGPSRDNLETLNFRRPSQLMGSPPPLFTGDTEPIPWRGGYERSARIWYTNDQPLPVTLLAILPVVSTNDDR